VLNWFNNLVNQGTDLARAAIYLLAIVSVGIVWAQKKAVVPVIATIIVAGIVIWAVSRAGQDNLRDKVGTDAGNAAPVLQLPAPVPGPGPGVRVELGAAA
jgi:hypothetical protein